ncbi:MAG: response regulator transcription factor [Chloroflexota bacterium]|nr:response regulator transcription factor [Chloroflexota bacterium]
MLTLAAVAGQRFDLSLLTHILHYDESHLLRLVLESLNWQEPIISASWPSRRKHTMQRWSGKASWTWAFSGQGTITPRAARGFSARLTWQQPYPTQSSMLIASTDSATGWSILGRPRRACAAIRKHWPSSRHTAIPPGAYWALGSTYFALREANLAIQALEAGLTVASAIGSAWWIGPLRAYLAQACLLKEAVPQAEAVLTAGIPCEQAPRNVPERLMVWAWGEVALANEDPEAALRLAERLLATVPGETSPQSIPQLLYLKGKALIVLQREHEAVQVIEAAKRGALARNARLLLWQVHAALGQAYQHLGQKEHARLAWGAAHTAIGSLAATIDDAGLRDHFLRVAQRSLPKESRLLARQAEAEPFAGLTERERTVARLIAQGHINREIAEALVVSERTVEAHVSNILSKLGFTSRRQIAAWAIEKGWRKTPHE